MFITNKRKNPFFHTLLGVFSLITLSAFQVLATSTSKDVGAPSPAAALTAPPSSPPSAPPPPAGACAAELAQFCPNLPRGPMAGRNCLLQHMKEIQNAECKKHLEAGPQMLRRGGNGPGTMGPGTMGPGTMGPRMMGPRMMGPGGMDNSGMGQGGNGGMGMGPGTGRPPRGSYRGRPSESIGVARPPNAKPMPSATSDSPNSPASLEPSPPPNGPEKK